MFTPQEIQEQTFSKAVFGGYDMQQVDDFLEPLTEDYIALYKENSVLKSKMKILVEKLEEYRGQEAAMKKTMAEAQAKCDKMLADAKAQCSAMVQTAEDGAARQKVEADIAAEQERLEYAKQTALNFHQRHRGRHQRPSRAAGAAQGPRPDRRRQEAGAAEARQALRLAGRQRTVARGRHVQQAHAGHRGRDLRESRKARRQRAGA